MFAIADCNSFYASCEKIFNPAVRKRPVVVLSNNDGCVIARSAEAKALRIPMGAAAHTVEHLIKQHNVAVFSSNFELYQDISDRVMTLLGEYSPEMEIYSIDEAFLRFDYDEHDRLFRTCWEMREKVKRGIGITIGVGVANTKTLCKLANWWAKKSGDGVTVISTTKQREELLKKAPIEDVWGVGRRYYKKLAIWGVKTAFDFVTKLSEARVLKMMTIVGVRTWKELQGIPCVAMEHETPEKQSIATTRSFGKMITDYAHLEEPIANFAHSCASKLRKNRLVAKKIMVFAHTNFFRDDLPQYSRNRVIKLPVATNDSIELIRYAKEALQSIYKEGYHYKKAGVVVSGIVRNSEIQLNFLDEVNREKQKKVMKAMDCVNYVYGRKAIQPAAVGTLTKRSKWHMRQERLSPRYTTRLDDIITVQA